MREGRNRSDGSADSPGTGDSDGERRSDGSVVSKGEGHSDRVDSHRVVSDRADDRLRPVRVVATGTFDLLHPGHVAYLEQAASLGDELHVIVATSEAIDHKPAPICSDRQRRDTVAALDAVDEAHVGHPTDFSVPIRRIDPDVLVLGYDQHHDACDVADALESWGIDCEVRRAGPCEPPAGDLYSSSAIVERVLDRRTRRLSPKRRS